MQNIVAYWKIMYYIGIKEVITVMDENIFNYVNIKSIAMKILEEIPDLRIMFGEKKTYQEIIKYTTMIMQLKQDQKTLNANEIAESFASDLLDSISCQNTHNFIVGMKTGATLIIQLLIYGN